MTDILVVKQHHKLRHVFTHDRIPMVNTAAQTVDQLQIARFYAVAQVSGKSNPAEAFWEHMHEKGIYECLSLHMQLFCLLMIRIVFIVEGYARIIHSIDAVVTDGTAKDIPCQILYGIAKSVKGLFYKRIPDFRIETVDKLFPFVGITQVGASAGQI